MHPFFGPSLPKRARWLLPVLTLFFLLSCGKKPPDAPPTAQDTTSADAQQDISTPDGSASDALLSGEVSDTSPNTSPNTSPDRDGDGILNAQELIDGTDPDNPRSARAFHPELTGHPRLFFGPEALPSLRARVQAIDEGTASEADTILYKRVRAISKSKAPPQPSDKIYSPPIAASRARVVVAAAFRALIEQDQAMADKAADLMSAPTPNILSLKPINPLETTSDLHDSEALVDLCTAWDYLSASGLVKDKLPTIHARLTERVKALRSLHEDTPIYKGLLSLMTNNHVMKYFGAQGLCALALPNRPEAAQVFNESITGLLFVLLRYQGNPAGGYAEGWNYLSYGDETWLPLLMAFHRLFETEVFPAEGATLLGEGTFTKADKLAGELQKIRDPATDPTLAAIYSAALRSARPDGLTVPTDDANPSRLQGALIAALLKDGRFLYNHALPAVGYHTSRQPSLSFALYPTDLQPETPSDPLDFSIPDAGFAVLRTSLSPDALFVHILAENGPVRGHGLGHEQADPLSFLLHAHGEALILDPGYINWEHHDLVRRGKDHNLVLVDGHGPPLAFDGLLDFAPPDEGFILDFTSQKTWASVLASASYLKTKLSRRLLRVNKRWVAVADTMEAETGPTTQRYTFQLNGNGGGDTPGGSFVQLKDGGRWIRDKAALRARVVTLAGEVTVSHRPEEHAMSWGKWKTHACLEVGSKMGGGAGFLTLLLPVKTGEAEPQSTLLRPKTGLAVGMVAVPEQSETWDAVVLNRLTQPQPVLLGAAKANAPTGLSLWRVVGAKASSVITLSMSPPQPTKEP